jgi:hypothetical protein
MHYIQNYERIKYIYLKIFIKESMKNMLKGSVAVYKRKLILGLKKEMIYASK